MKCFCLLPIKKDLIKDKHKNATLDLFFFFFKYVSYYAKKILQEHVKK